MFLQSNLTEDEEKIIKLLQLDKKAMAFDYKIDDQVKSVVFKMYEFDNEQGWVPSTGGGTLIPKSESGRIGMTLEKSPDKVTFSLQDDEGTSSITAHSPVTIERQSTTEITAYLAEEKEIKYDVEIPMAIQAFTKGYFNGDLEVEDFNSPTQFKDDIFKHVYVATVTFSTTDPESN